MRNNRVNSCEKKSRSDISDDFIFLIEIKKAKSSFYLIGNISINIYIERQSKD